MRQQNLIKILTDYKQFQIFILGIFSGIPLFVIYTTLAAWMSQKGVDISIIASLAAARMFYSFKVFWAPFVDNIKIPLLHKLGRRKSWMYILFFIISCIMFCYNFLDPDISISKIFWLTIVLGFTSATLDIVIDAYRIDNIEKEQLSIASANAVLGWRIGGLIAGVGAFYIASYYSWSAVFLLFAIIYLIGLVFVFTLKEEKVEAENIRQFSIDFWKKAILEPFIDFFKKEKSMLILLAIIFYKLGDAFLGVIATPFYIKLGFTLLEIAVISKLYGVVATVCGAYLGGVIMYRYGNLKGLIICGIAQSITNLAYIWLNHCGHDNSALIITITVENIASGMGDAALVGYLGYLCNKHFSATQYALLSGASGLFSHTIVAFGGIIVNAIGWDVYFLMTVFLSLPGILMLVILKK